MVPENKTPEDVELQSAFTVIAVKVFIISQLLFIVQIQLILHFAKLHKEYFCQFMNVTVTDIQYTPLKLFKEPEFRKAAGK